MARYESTPLRACCAIVVGLSPALVIAHLRTQAALSALGFEGWRDLYLSHLQTIAYDFGASFVVALFVWLICHWAVFREAKYAALVGVASFYVVPTALGSLFLFEYGFSLSDLLALLLRQYWIVLLGSGVLALLMWRIAYRGRKASDEAAVFA